MRQCWVTIIQISNTSSLFSHFQTRHGVNTKILNRSFRRAIRCISKIYRKIRNWTSWINLPISWRMSGWILQGRRLTRGKNWVTMFDNQLLWRMKLELMARCRYSKLINALWIPRHPVNWTEPIPRSSWFRLTSKCSRRTSLAPPVKHSTLNNPRTHLTRWRNLTRSPKPKIITRARKKAIAKIQKNWCSICGFKWGKKAQRIHSQTSLRIHWSNCTRINL